MLNNPNRYQAPVAARIIFDTSDIMSLRDMARVCGSLATVLPADYCPYPLTRVKLKFGRFSVSCIENREALEAVARKLAKGPLNNISTFKLPKGNKYDRKY